MRESGGYTLVLSVYLNARGFAFVLFDGHLSPAEWGVRNIHGHEKQPRCLEMITNLVEHYEPDVLLTEDMSPHGTRRVPRIVRLNLRLLELAAECGIRVHEYSRADVYEAFKHYGLSNKHMIAELIAKHIPAFKRYVPPPRKRWMPEDSRMGLFDAAALALVFFRRAGGSA
jgi:hypothetical protein